MIKDPTRMYCAVRLDEDTGREWLDISTLTASREIVAILAKEPGTNRSLSWAQANPVQRIARVEIQEIEEAKNDPIRESGFPTGRA